MTKKEQEKRILELEKLVEQQSNMISILQAQIGNAIPYVGDVCIDGKEHQYPNPWLSTTAPACTKCGKPAQMTEITFGTTTGDHIDFNQFGGNMMYSNVGDFTIDVDGLGEVKINNQVIN